MAKFDDEYYQEHEFEGYGSLRQRKARRQFEANERAEARSSRGDAGQLARLNKLGFRAERERARLGEVQG